MKAKFANINRADRRPHGKSQGRGLGRHHGRGRGRGLYREVLDRADLFEKFKRQEEDILKYIFEADKQSVEISKLKKVFKYINGDIDQIIQNLINAKYIILNENSLTLTLEGEEIAGLIFRIHNEIEDYIKGRDFSCNAHQMAHILEHKLTEEEIDKMIKASELKEKGIPLSNFSLPSGTIVEVALRNCAIWTKLVSIGVFPGQKIHILSRTSSNYLIEIKNSKFALDSQLANGIFLIP
jgi:Mn-dependent DtxR family transcriptional regulator/Fe2+ transport system protein FeoA